MVPGRAGLGLRIREATVGSVPCCHAATVPAKPCPAGDRGPMWFLEGVKARRCRVRKQVQDAESPVPCSTHCFQPAAGNARSPVVHTTRRCAGPGLITNSAQCLFSLPGEYFPGPIAVPIESAWPLILMQFPRTGTSVWIHIASRIARDPSPQGVNGPAFWIRRSSPARAQDRQLQMHNTRLYLRACRLQGAWTNAFAQQLPCAPTDCC